MSQKKYKHLYRIIGKDLRYGAQGSWGEFDNLKDCLVHMDALNRSWGDIIKFKWEEIWEEIKNDN